MADSTWAFATFSAAFACLSWGFLSVKSFAVPSPSLSHVCSAILASASCIASCTSALRSWNNALLYWSWKSVSSIFANISPSITEEPSENFFERYIISPPTSLVKTVWVMGWVVPIELIKIWWFVGVTISTSTSTGMLLSTGWGFIWPSQYNV